MVIKSPGRLCSSLVAITDRGGLLAVSAVVVILCHLVSACRKKLIPLSCMHPLQRSAYFHLPIAVSLTRRL